ncbi:MAG: ornithine cyclodeaminase family protein [Planctomycetales bacterium]|nr:ornithine cyclodeaminase family protein [Planctomycetales bacterium]
MSAAADYLRRVGWKQYTTTRQGARFLVGLYQADTGALEAIIEADRLGQLRTGAATGVAVKHLCGQGVTEMGLIGTGGQAEAQLAAVCQVRTLRRAVVWGRDRQRRERFAERMSGSLDLDVTPADGPRAAVVGMPLVVTATNSRTPVLEGDWLAEGATLCAIGSNAVSRAEIDVTTVGRAGRVVCDQIDACRLEAGELVAAAAAGHFDWSAAVELAQVVAGNVPGRQDDRQLVLFKSVGLAIEDVALASRIVDRARQAGLGATLPV